MKHTKNIKRIVSSYLGIQPHEKFDRDIYLFEEEMDYLRDKIFLYMKRHKNAYKELGLDMFGNSNDELRRISMLLLFKLGLKIEENG